MNTTNSSVFVVDVKEVLSVLTVRANDFREGCHLVANVETGARTVKMPKGAKLSLLGETRNSLPVTPESLILAIGAVQLHILNNPDSVQSPTHAKEFAECLIAVTGASAHVMSLKFGVKAEDAGTADKIVKTASTGLVSYFDTQKAAETQAVIDGGESAADAI